MRGKKKFHIDFKAEQNLLVGLNVLPWLSGKICILKVLLLWAWKINNKLEQKTKTPLSEYSTRR